MEPKAPHLTRTRLLYATIAVPVFAAAIVLFLVLPRSSMRGEEPPPQASNTAGQVGLHQASQEAEFQAPTAYERLNDSELFFAANQDLQSGAAADAKAKLEELLRRDPHFAGSADLLAKAERDLQWSVEMVDVSDVEVPDETNSAGAPVLLAQARGDTKATQRTSPRRVRNTQPPQPVALSEPQLFYEATMAQESGDFETSKAKLEELLQRNPTFSGASDLLTEVGDEIWKQTLPVSFEARHRHRIGGCSGTLSLAVGSIRFSSDAHEWEWKLGAIRVVERTDARNSSSRRMKRTSWEWESPSGID